MESLQYILKINPEIIDKNDRYADELCQALQLKPNNCASYSILGFLYYIFNDFEQALENFNQSLAQNSNQIEILRLKAISNFNLKLYSKVILLKMIYISQKIYIL